MSMANTDQLPDAAIVTPQGFPWGLCCAGCGCGIGDGQSYCSVPDWVTTDGDVVGLIVCAACALVPRPTEVIA